MPLDKKRVVLAVVSSSSLTIDLASQLHAEDAAVPPDVRLISRDEGQEFLVHQAILMARSRTLRQRLIEHHHAARRSLSSSASSSSPEVCDSELATGIEPVITVDLSRYSAECLECTLIYIYSDKIKLPSDDLLLPEMVELSRDLELTHMEHLLRKRLRYNGALGNTVEHRFLPTLSSDLLGILNDPKTSDVCIEVEGRRFYCHRAILAARCKFFQAMFGGDWRESSDGAVLLAACESAYDDDDDLEDDDGEARCRTRSSNHVTLGGMSIDGFERVLHYCYTDILRLGCTAACTAPQSSTSRPSSMAITPGRILSPPSGSSPQVRSPSVFSPQAQSPSPGSPRSEASSTSLSGTPCSPMHHALELFYMASYLATKDLQSRCEDAMVPLINETNLCAIWEMAHENQLSGLLKHCKSFFISHFQACVAHPSFTSIRKSLLHEALIAGAIDADDEVIFDGIRRWAQANATPECPYDDLILEMMPPKVLFSTRIRQRVLSAPRLGFIPSSW